ncbi:MAG: T9SS type A sorting domain-containing protein [Ignavibacteria bacterium]
MGIKFELRFFNMGRINLVGYDNYSLEIYDILGIKVETLFNKYHQPGKYRITYDAIKLSSGIYFYRLSSSKYFEIRKFMLVKLKVYEKTNLHTASNFDLSTFNLSRRDGYPELFFPVGPAAKRSFHTSI